MKILVGCNLLTSVNSMAYSSHMQFWCNVGRHFNEKDVIFFCPRRMSIDRMRNEAASLALAHECDYLFFYDDDVHLPSDALTDLIKTAQIHEALVVGGVTQVRSYPFKPMIFKYLRQDVDNSMFIMGCYNDYEKNVDENGVVKCDALGFSCCLIDVKALKNTRPPYFVTGSENTEDVYFCHKINTELEPGHIVVNTNVTTGHMLDQYFISPGNKQHFVRLEKGLYNKYPGIIDNDKHREDRGAEYREQVMERIRRAQAAM